MSNFFCKALDWLGKTFVAALKWIGEAFWGPNVEDHISLLTFIGVVVGGIFALIQWKKSIALKRAEYIKELTEKIRTDEDIFKTIYMFDYGVQWYNSEFHQSEKERVVDRTLAYFSYILYLRNEKLISKKEFSFFSYDIERILRNNQLQDYFYNLFHFAKTQGVPFSFDILLKYAKERELLDPDFENPEAYKKCKKYHHYLDF